MTRTTTANEDTAIAAEVIRPVNLVKLDFPSGTVRVTDAPFTLSFDDGDGSVDYLGVGDLGSISAIEETVDGKTNKVTLTLSGLNAALVSTAVNEAWRWKRATIYRGFLDADNVLVETPRVRFKGWMSNMPFSLGNDSESASISVEVSSRFARWEQAYDNPKWSDADHQLKRSGDKFFQFQAEIEAGKEVFWGRSR